MNWFQYFNSSELRKLSKDERLAMLKEYAEKSESMPTANDFTDLSFNTIGYWYSAFGDDQEFKAAQNIISSYPNCYLEFMNGVYA